MLYDEKNLIEKIKGVQQRFKVKDIQNICIEDISTEESICIEIYGIQFNRKIKIGCIYSKKIRNSTNILKIQGGNF